MTLQENDKRSQLLFITAICMIIVVSYSFYASSNYPLLNSDDGMAILMAHYFELPRDVYCWGQDRLGSLIPLMSQGFMKGFGTSAMTAVSLSNYLILILGYIGFSSLIKPRYGKLVFALIWFFPFQRFIDLTRYTIGVEYSLIAFAIFLMLRLQFENKSFFYWKNHALLLAINLVLGAALWASDLSIVTITILLVVLYVHHFIKKRTFIIRKEAILYTLAGIVGWTYFILLAKSYAVAKTEDFASFNGISEMLDGLSMMFRSTFDVMLYSEHDFFTTLYTWLAPIFIGILVVLIIRKKINVPADQRKWVTFLLLDFCLVMGVILLSQWVLINEMGRRYFVASYITMSLLIVILVENAILTQRYKRLLKAGLLTVVIVGAISPIYNMQFVNGKSLRSMKSVSKEFTQLGEIGLIGGYWNAYRISCAYPETLVATPDDLSDVKNRELVPLVFAQPKLYIVRDGWMTSFPDTMIQFKIPLKRVGKEQLVGGHHIQQYKRLSLSKVYKLPEMHTSNEAFVETAEEGQVIHVKPVPEARDQFILSGPNCTLVPGDYRVRYKIKGKATVSDTVVGQLIVSAEYGLIPIGQRDMNANELSPDEFRSFEVRFHLREFTFNVEFLFKNIGNAELVIEEVELIEQ
ncbi:MAG: hypothetical protein A3D31_18350 [Candidatus Fluviicola riflensis]|nr:MAG: hypothetical protein CHH17_03290 [Candidatus Fluviicola riflensis]OGS76936.1 MAG: hypothetical protein A3D31_18350 [Candidatus Fluviicola riflensis]OGS81865.1 MAG: hypothetical protein A2724_15750 [Fluviicola sp. RIFCSPHIGHO2_01_FULL_43_53]OGS88664.1 MAG: hypothetical protein A3E30_07855 [Fluviicola sp. RIFCSPHIGHO2_12_FULL_43_24]